MRLFPESVTYTVWFSSMTMPMGLVNCPGPLPGVPQARMRLKVGGGGGATKVSVVTELGHEPAVRVSVTDPAATSAALGQYCAFRVSLLGVNVPEPLVVQVTGSLATPLNSA